MMNCEEATEVLRSGQEAAAQPRALANEHLLTCAECRLAALALVALEAERRAQVPAPDRHSFERAMRRAVQRPVAAAARRRGFWLGAAVGGAMAAGLAVAVTTLWLQSSTLQAPANPGVTLALNEVRDVSVSIDSPEMLSGAEIRVVLTGAVGLQGFDEQRELRWVADLDRGLNQLTLPLIARGASGGQVTVEVQHGDKLRTFVLDIQTEPNAAPTV